MEPLNDTHDQRVDYINDISDLLWRFDDTPGDGLENPAGTKVREPKRVHDLDSLHDAVREWESEATAPWVGYKPRPEQEGEVCTDVTVGEVREKLTRLPCSSPGASNRTTMCTC